MRKHIRKILSLALAAVMCLSLLPAAALAADAGGVPIDQEHFPDNNFRALVVAKLPGAEDNFLTDAELAQVEEIISPYEGDRFTSNDPTPRFRTLAGIEYFPNLKVLEVPEHLVSPLNLRHNTELTRLNVEACGLGTLDLSQNTKLTELNACRNSNLNTVDLSHNTKLAKLNLSYNYMKELDLSHNTELAEVNCEWNLLTGVVFANNTKLTDLNLCHNWLSTVDLTQTPNLLRLDVSDNRRTGVSGDTWLSSLDLSSVPLLEKLDCSSNALPELDLSHNNKLTFLDCGENKLTALDAAGLKDLRVLLCSDNKLTEVDVTRNTKLTELAVSGTEVTSLDLSQNPDLTSLSISKTKLSELDLSQNTKLTSLGLSGCSELSEVDLSMLPELATLYCTDCSLNKLDLSHNNKLTFLDCSRSLNLTELDVSKQPALEELYCSMEKLTSLDVTHNPKLTKLECHADKIPELDVSKNTELLDLSCGSEQLTELDVTQNTKLTRLYCNAPVTKLDLSCNPELASLGGYMALISLDVSHNPKLELSSQYVYGKRTVRDGTPLSELPELDVSKVSNVSGGSFEGGKVTFTDLYMTYTYDCGRGQTKSFKLLKYQYKNTFKDVSDNAWFAKPVQWAVENGITKGMSDSEFGPTAPCNRAQIVTFLWKMMGSPMPKDAKNPFTDVPEKSWFTNAVLWAVENNITNGMTPTEFGPTVTCSRAQAMMLLWKAMHSPRGTIELSFKDVPKGAWFYEAVRWAVEEGVTKGMSETEFGSNAPCNRAQIVTFLYAAHNIEI